MSVLEYEDLCREAVVKVRAFVPENTSVFVQRELHACSHPEKPNEPPPMVFRWRVSAHVRIGDGYPDVCGYAPELEAAIEKMRARYDEEREQHEIRQEVRRRYRERKAAGGEA